MKLDLIGGVALQIGASDDTGLGIVFDIGTLSIFNSVSKRNCHEFHELIGHSVIEEIESMDEYYCIRFDHGAEILVSLVPADYTGPESMVFYGTDGAIVVWN